MTDCPKCHAVNTGDALFCKQCGYALDERAVRSAPSTRRCPFCAEEIQPAAIVCKHCGRDVPARPESPPVLARRSASPGLAPSPPTAPAAIQPVRRLSGVAKVLLTLAVILTASVVGILILAVALEVTDPSAARGKSTVSAPPASTPKRATPTWQVVKRWTGSGIKETETFSVASREWRISWTASNEAFAGAGILQVYVHNERGEMVSLAANKQGTGGDISYVRAPPGRFYLTINSGNVNWDVTVEDQR